MDTKQFIEEHLHDDVHELALKHSNAKVDMALALRQIEARQLLQKKVPSWSSCRASIWRNAKAMSTLALLCFKANS